MGEERFQALRMLGARTRRRALLGADNDGSTRPAAGDVAYVRGLVDDLVERHQHEVAPHDFHDRLHTHQSCADGRTQNRALGDRRVENAVSAEVLLQASRGAEDAPGPTDILAIDDHLRTGGQFAGQALR